MDTEGNGLGESMRAERLPGKAHHLTRSGHPLAQVRGVVAEWVVVSTALDPFLSLRALAAFSGLGVRERDWRQETGRCPRCGEPGDAAHGAGVP